MHSLAKELERWQNEMKTQHRNALDREQHWVGKKDDLKMRLKALEETARSSESQLVLAKIEKQRL